MLFPKNNIYLKTLLLLIITILGFMAFQQPDNGLITKVLAKLSRYNDYYKHDKIYVHTDRSYYASGETIWLKAYQVDALQHLPHSKSKVVYVELLNNGNKVVAGRKLQVANGIATGDIDLPADLSTGTYTLRAYNKWMLNFNTAYLFITPVHIFNLADQPSETAVEPTHRNIDVQFFPEGGYLVNTLPGTVAFKAVNNQGKGIQVQGVVTEENGDTITAFQSLHLGMGAFKFEPQAGKRYTANIQLSDSTIARFPLPQVQIIGWAMAVDNSMDDAIHVGLQSTANISAQATISTQATVIAHVRGTVVFSATASLTGKPAALSIPKDKIPEGIVHITAFNEEGNPMCERLVYVQKQQHLQVQISTEKKVYAPREKVSLGITVKDTQGNPVAANLSMSVADAAHFQTPGFSSTIVNYLLLTSDLKGYIEDPGFYFSGDTNAAKALDLLLLTQGWRRFVWKDVLQDTQSDPVYDTEDGISLAGRLIDPATKKAVPNQLITLSVPSGNPAFVQQYTDVEGNFYFTGVHYQNDKEIYLRSIGATSSQPMQFEIDTVKLANIAQLPAVPLPENTIHQFVAQSRSREKIMEAFAPEDSMMAGQQQEAETLGTATNPAIVDVPADHSVNLDNYNEFPDMAETLKEVVPGILIKNKKGVYSLKVLDIKRKLYFKNDPVYFIDGLLLTGNDAFLKLDPSTVQTIEVYGRPDKLARFETLGKNGVLAAYTRNGNYTPEDKQGLLRFNYKGYHPVREFYTPVYTPASNSHQQPDLRPVIYWNPTILTDANGKAQITFYNGDNITNYQVHLEGISDTGLPIATNATYQVKLPLQSRK